MRNAVQETETASVKSIEVWLSGNFQGCKWLDIAKVEGTLCRLKGDDFEEARRD